MINKEENNISILKSSGKHLSSVLRERAF